MCGSGYLGVFKVMLGEVGVFYQASGDAKHGKVATLIGGALPSCHGGCAAQLVDCCAIDRARKG